MSKKYHINKHGVPALCRATEGNCPYGGKDGTENHYDSLEKAQLAADKLNGSEFPLLPTQKAMFTAASNEEDMKKIENRLRHLRRRSAKRREETDGKKSNYVDRCRGATLIPDYVVTGDKTSHFKDDRTGKDSRLDRMYGEGETLGYYKVNQLVKDVNGNGVYKDQVTEIRSNGKITIYDYEDGRKITSFMAHDERVEVIMLRSNRIPERELLDTVRKNSRDERKHQSTMKSRHDKRRRQLSRRHEKARQ